MIKNDESTIHPILKDLKIDQQPPAVAIALLSYCLTNGTLSVVAVHQAFEALSSARIATTSYSQEDSPGKTAPVFSSAASVVQKDQTRMGLEKNVANGGTKDTTILSHHRTRHVALHLYYDGENYSGLAENIGQPNDASIERSLFTALKQAHLVASRDSCQFSRCGRTDKGVSAFGQVVALYLKSAFPLEATMEHPLIPASSTELGSFIDYSELPKNSFDPLTVWVLPRKKKATNSKSTYDSSSAPYGSSPLTPHSPYVSKTLREYAYDKILNNLLPPNIRVLGWCPVSPDFSARFSCVTRTYRYFFCAPSSSMMPPSCDGNQQLLSPSQLSIDRMREGLQHLVGTHDFRNFCKMDVEKVYNFMRTVHSAEVVTQTTLCDKDICYVRIVGQAFLWHQIRCIMHVLFLIGRGLEEPSIVQDLLNVELYPGKPSYPLADERPLVLQDCQYHKLSIGYSVANLWNVMCQQEQQWEDLVLAATRIRNCFESMQDKIVRTDELIDFCTSKLQQRKKKQQRGRPTGATGMSDIPPIRLQEFETNTVTWKVALAWLNKKGVVMDPLKLLEVSYTPLLDRSKGTTYEEKVAALDHSAKRQQKYESNVIKKRKTKEDDLAFYRYMSKQGGSSIE
jgi:tRNA pseudouridine38/39 synthase